MGENHCSIASSCWPWRSTGNSQWNNLIPCKRHSWRPSLGSSIFWLTLACRICRIFESRTHFEFSYHSEVLKARDSLDFPQLERDICDSDCGVNLQELWLKEKKLWCCVLSNVDRHWRKLHNYQVTWDLEIAWWNLQLWLS